MFTGLIEDTGEITDLKRFGNALKMSLKCDIPPKEIMPGDSVAVDGVCLTATNISAAFTFDVSPESLKLTTLGTKKVGDKVNLERALQLSDRLGGHLVTGHIDGIATIDSITRKGDFFEIVFTAPDNILRYVIEKGSVSVNGISLTINQCTRDDFRVMIIPHTFSSTTLCGKRKGDHVNIENDIIGKYVEKFLLKGNNKSGVTKELLEKFNFK